MTTVEHTDFASPLSLLSQWQNRPDGGPLREFLVLGFTADLVFLERFAVSKARQLGARVTVVSDADHQIHDPVDIRYAGHVYQHGAVTTQGAFHPKLAVLVGDDEIWTAVGSGNPTMSGWGHNHELWCVLRGSRQSGLRAQAEIGEWLRALPRHVVMPGWIADTLKDVGAALRPTQVDNSRPDVALLHNLDAPILDRLPAEATEVNLAAPFIDPSGAAVRAILDRAQPARVRVALQSELSSFNGRTLTAAAGRTEEAEFREVDEERTMHGKLIEHVERDGRIRAVVGSANVTSAALLRTVGDGGNCELSISALVDRSLLPDARRVSAAEVAQWRPEERDRDPATPSLRLLGARRLDHSIELVVVCGATAEVTVECSPDGSPGSWQPRATFAVTTPGAPLTWTVDSPEAPGAAVRLAATFDGVVVESVPAFVTDPHRCRTRADAGTAPQLRRPYEPEEIITDAGVLERFSRDLLNLLRLSAEQRATTATLRSPIGEGGNEARADKDAWTQFLDHASHSLGTSLTELTFPGALPSPTGTVSPNGWALGVVEDETELTDDETGNEIERIDELVGREARRVPPEARARYRSWIRRWVTAITPTPEAPAPPLPMRMTVAALYLELLAAGVWGGEDGWRGGLADIVLALVTDRTEIDESPGESHAYLGSLVAICLAVLGHDATVRGGRPADVILSRAWEPAHPVAIWADDAVVDSLLLRSEDIGARRASRSEVTATVKLACDAVADPLAETRASLAAAGLEVEREHGAWIVRGTFRKPMRPAAQTATDLFTGEPLTCVATTGTHSVIIARSADTVAMLDSKVGRWRLHDLRRPRTPFTLFGQDEGLPAPRQVFAAWPVPPAVVAIAGSADVDALLRAFGPPQPRSKDGAWTDWDW